MPGEPIPLTATVAQFMKLSGLGKTRTYALIKEGKLQSTRACGRRVILMDSYAELLGQRALADRIRSHAFTRDNVGMAMDRPENDD